MIKPVILGLVIFIRILFEVFEGDPRMWIYIITGAKVPIQNFIWTVNEFISMIAVSTLSIFRDNRYIFTQRIFAGVAILDLADFMLTGNTVWWYWGQLPVSMNILGISIFGLGLIYEIWKTRMNSFT